MLEEPCRTCGEMLDINDDVCPRCGMLRRRTRPPRTATAGWLLPLACAIVAGLIGAFLGAGWETGGTTTGVSGGVAVVSMVGGAVCGLVLQRVWRRK